VAVPDEPTQVVRRLHRDRYVIVAACESPRLRDRLKMGGRLVVGGAHLQCAQYGAAVDEIVAREILEQTSPVELLHGDGREVFYLIRVARSLNASDRERIRRASV
jgi:hypothetical protein